jgi:alpha-amylase
VEAQVVSDMKFWLARGVDGFRLDAARYLVETDAGQADIPETHALLKRIRAALVADYPDAMLVGEVWTATPIVATYWGSGDELHLAFAFDQALAIQQSLQAGDRTAFRTAVANSNLELEGKDRRFDAPFLTNHDQDRVMRALGGSAAEARAAAATLFAVPGTPFVYYGEELGMQGGSSCGDECKRTPYRWTASGPGYGFTSGTPWFTAAEAGGVDLATERADGGSLWSLYRTLVALRQSDEALAKGDAALPTVTGGGPGLIALLRTQDAKRVLFVVNMGTAASGAFTVNVSGSPTVLLSEGVAGAPTRSGADLAFAGLDARGFAFYTLE